MSKSKTPDLLSEDNFEEVKTKVNPADIMKSLADTIDNSKKMEFNDSVLGSETGSLRATRDMETREADEAEQTWRPADVLPDPPQRPGWVHRWVRGASRGEVDKLNMAKAMREGWRPCAATDYPEIIEAMPFGGASTDLIEFGGLILCRMTEKMAKQREKYFRDKAMRQINSVNDRLKEEARQEGNVAILNESKSIRNKINPYPD